MSDRCSVEGCEAFVDAGGRYCGDACEGLDNKSDDWWQENGNRLGDRVVKIEKMLERIESKLDQLLPKTEIRLSPDFENPKNRPDLLRKEFDPD